MASNGKRKLSTTAGIAGCAMLTVIGLRYGLPRIGLAEQPPIRIGTIERAAKADRQPVTRRADTAPGQTIEALITSHELAAASTASLRAEDVSSHRAFIEAAQVAPQGTASLLPLLPSPAAPAGDITGSIGPGSGDGIDTSPLTEERTFSTIEVVDGRSFRANGVLVRLAGIALPRANRMCQNIDGTTEPCLERARTRLDLITRHRPLNCQLEGADKPQTFSGHCKVGTTDLATWLTREGWVLPTEKADDLQPALAEAKRIKAGIWR